MSFFIVQLMDDHCLLDITTEPIPIVTRLIDSSRRLNLDKIDHEPTYGYDLKNIGSSRTSGREDHIKIRICEHLTAKKQAAQIPAVQAAWTHEGTSSTGFFAF
ncbi:unnamed protein product [Fusarium venenatum]|uniref:Uncharacterized protein n=1 Tax=Fusarium venenatum TaxID=56646 RepID=A0A2L2TGM3_9HYPO|nr:uncharacterized protein FVRRES_01073 [Fusarium venenatum]CEI64561.1 unnamed protein product [Fusarium venenatum]